MMVPIKNFYLKLICISLLFFLFILQLSVIAADVTIIPSLTLKGEYNDNVFYSRTNEVDDYLGHINPALEFGYVSELLDLKASADVDFLYYSDETDRDTETQLYELEGVYQIFERWEISGDGSYRKDTTLDSYLEETGRVNVSEDRRHYTAGGGLSYEITERSDIDINYAYSKTDYELDSSTDNERHTIALSYNNILKNNLDIITLQPSYSYRNSYGSHGNLDVSEADTYTLSFIWTHPFNETLRLESKIGGRYTEQSYNDGRRDEDNWGVVADMSLSKTAQKYSVLMGYSRDLKTNLDGDEIEVDRIYCNLNRQITERLKFGISGSLYFSRLDARSNTTNTDEDRRFYEIRPLLNYLITENHYLELAYSYSNEKDDDEEPSKRDRNRVWLNITFTFPKKW